MRRELRLGPFTIVTLKYGKPIHGFISIDKRWDGILIDFGIKNVGQWYIGLYIN